jgi:uncharacterized lipoprotein YajG
MENKIEKPIEGIYIQIFENKRVVQKYVPLSQVIISGGITLGEHLEATQAQIKALNKALNATDERLGKIQALQAEYQKATNSAFAVVIEEQEKDKFL